MSIGSTIKQLRHEHDMTQEKLAELLNVSTAAISAWECDRNCPDISQLPILARIFGVSSDHLLGIDFCLQDEKIDKILFDAEKHSGREKVSIYRLALAEFPSSYRLMKYLATALNYSGEPETYNNRMKERIILYERICQGAKEPHLKNEAQYHLCSMYLKQGKRDEALRIAEAVTSLKYSNNDFELLLAQGKEKIHNIHYNVKNNFVSLCNDICNISTIETEGKPFFTHEQAISLLSKIPGLYEVFYENNDYLEDGAMIASVYARMAEHFAELMDKENTLSCVKSAIDHAKKTDEYYNGLETGPYGISDVWDYPQIPKEKRHTSILADPGYDYPTTTIWIDKTTESNVFGITSCFSHSRFDFVRSQVNELLV